MTIITAAEMAEHYKPLGDLYLAYKRIEKLEADNAQMRGLLGEAEVKLTDVQGAYASKRYADNLLARISAALQETSHAD